MLNKKIVLAAAATAMIFTLSTGNAAKPSKGGGDGTGDGHSHNDLSIEVDDLSTEIDDLRSVVAELQANQCVPNLEINVLEGQSITSSTSTTVSAQAPGCPLPSVRIGIECDYTAFAKVNDQTRVLSSFQAVENSVSGECFIGGSSSRANLDIEDGLTIDIINFGYDTKAPGLLSVTASSVCATVSCTVPTPD